ncbi:putative type IX secretion system sortase PorU2 [Pontibacter flavimaris]|uniref:Gingipain domain-containing protein n=1 Tax=Pontibacter flavimaris TaxID=1797110 RepID=A0A1Q5PD44_9BACT|nr:C25 family cysteine peptidase [Pontibacter flavimaris]OKL40169.1 hypothetical protein A3841_17670 [Pontibacter flavimaris]
MYKTFSIKAFFSAVILAVAGLAAGTAQAQEVYGNEWIDYSKTYHKLQVVETGLYKLDHAYLRQLGLENVNPQHLQLFRRGKEVAIYVAGEADGRLDPQDYLEFYGERNDGVLDQELYKNPAYQVHQLHSMYTDSAAYFLTVNPAGGNKRMREANPSPNGLTPEPYHWQKAMLLSTGTYSEGRSYKDNKMPWLDAGEGYFSVLDTAPKKLSFEITGISNVETTGPAPSLNIATLGPNEGVHKFDVNIIGGRTITSISYNSYDFSRTNHQIDFTDINLQNQKLSLQLSPISGNSGKIGLAYAQLTYPQKSIFIGNAMFFYTDSLRVSPQYYEFAGASLNVVAYDVTDEGEVVRIAGHASGEKRGYVVDHTGSTRKVLLASSSASLTPVGRTRNVKFRKIIPAEHNFLIVSNKALMKKVGASNLPAPLEYAAYRNSAAGGGYDTLLVFVDDLVNQFHYGEFSANSIRRFCSYMLSTPRDRHLLLLGKGVEIYRSSDSWSSNLVPTGGVPASDVLFTADFRRNEYAPKIPTGRVSARSALEVMNYLDKVKTHEAVPDGVEWRKNILHLGGGKTVNEINTFTSYIRNYEEIAEGPLLGANVIERSRKNLSEVTESLDVSKEINAGVSLVTFFGHSSPGIIDLDIGSPSSALSSYNNEGKYPIMLMNGCNLGNAYIKNNVSFGEDWLNTPKKGAIALIAHTGTGYTSQLNTYSRNFYLVGFSEEEFYGRTLGEVQKEVIRRVVQNSWDDNMIAMVLESALQGDPAVKLYNPIKPDYLLDDKSFSLNGLDGGIATAAADSIVLNFKAKNLGKAITDSVYLSIKRTFPDNSRFLYDSIRIAPVFLENQIKVTLANKGFEALGINSFEVKIDSPESIDELNEKNNIAVYQQYISASGLSIIHPIKYSIVGVGKVSLTVQGQSKNLNKGVYFEIDTTHTFDSPWTKTHSVPTAVFASWDVDLLNGGSNDSTVYYWRARFTTYEQGEDTVWAQSSFRHIPQIPSGWSQSRYGQFTESSLSGIETIDKSNGNWRFKTVRKFINLKTVGGDIKFSYPPYGFYIDGDQVLNWQCGHPNYYDRARLYMVVFDNVTLEPLTNLGGTVTCPASSFLFDTNDLTKAANVAKIKRFIDAVPEGYYVAVMSVDEVPFEKFPDETKAAFRSIGSLLIDELKNKDPFVIVGQKGAAPGTAQEKTFSKPESEREEGTPASSQSIALSVTLQSKRQAGTITSTAIGPALRWGSLHHDIKPYAGGDDKYKLSLIGIDAAGEETVLEESISSRVFDISHIDANKYPSLKLAAFLSDSTARTAPQLREWFVLYDPVPEGVIRPDLVKASSEELSRLAGGGRLTIPMAFQNVTSTAFTDSLTVEVVFTGSGVSTTTSTFKIKPVGPNETVYFTYPVSTAELDGDYRISIYVNPRLLPEQEYANNIYEVDFGVKSKLHPIMDVAFDGIYILDGDIVSPSPLISVTVKDENRHVFLQDPSRMSVVLITDQNPNGEEIELLNNPEVTYTPATEANDFKLEYRPAKLEDNKYTLQVRATDAVGKESGVSPYRIGFEVVSEASISNFYPFPNPFSSKTNFIFTITGSTIPEHIKIQILTITGKVVKEIMKEELGPLRIGNNKTDYAWDGTDMYGDRLANGVYLYRVVMSKGEEEMKHRNTFGDGAFKNGYGKLYILR